MVMKLALAGDFFLLYCISYGQGEEVV